MRPHTRTQCNDGKDCVECGRGDLSAASQPSNENINETANGAAAAINHKNVAVAGQVDSTNAPQDKTEKSTEHEDRRPSTSDSSNNQQINPEERRHQEEKPRNGANGEYFVPSSILETSTSKILSSSFSSSPSSPFIVPTTRGRRSMSNAAAQAALGGHKMDEITTNLPPRRSSVAISTKLHHTTNEREAAPRGAKTNGNYGQLNRSMLIVELPAEILVKIMNYMSFNEIGQVRLVSRRFNEICASMLNSTFQRLQSHMLSRFQAIKAQMPRRESARRNHPLARECDIVETLHMRLTLLQMTFGKHIERKHVCFFAGEILDEVQRILYYIRENASLGRAYKVTDELFDLSTMAMEYFKEHIEPTLPEITFFGAEFLDFTTPFTSPTKRRSQSGNTSILGGGIDSPCSSRASVAGSSCSEPWSTSSNGGTVDDSSNVSNLQGAGSMGSVESGIVQDFEPRSNMVLRKRIRRIRQGMKKYNDQLVEVKRELKGCKTKMEAQTKQVHEYSSRLEEYDKKFEENSRKFQTMLTELNKCKTELQYWRSKSTTLLSLPPTCAQCEAPLFPENLSSLADAGLFSKSDDGYSQDAADNDLKALANQGVFPDDIYHYKDENADDKQNTEKKLSEHDIQVQTKSTAGAGPPSPGYVAKSTPQSPSASFAMSPNGNSSAAMVGRKRRSRDEVVDDLQPGESSGTRKSLRGAGVKSTRGKRPKVAIANI